MSGFTESDDDIIRACVDCIAHTGAASFSLHHSDPDEGTVVWTAVAEYHHETRPPVMACGAAAHPIQAVLRLVEEVLDGGQCQHCMRPSAFSTDLSSMPLDKFLCWYAYDPELKTIRRGCSGEGTPE